MSLVWAETRKLLRTPGVLVTTGLIILFTAHVYWQTAKNVSVGMWQSALLAPEDSLTYTLAAMATIGPLLAAAIGAVSAGQEFGYGTWPALLTHGASRTQLWGAKILSIVATLGGWLIGSAAVGYVGSLWGSGRAALPVFDGLVVAQMGNVFFALGFWALFAFATALAFRGTAAGLAGGIGFPILEMFLQTIPGLRDWLPVWNQRVLNATVFGTEPRGMTLFLGNPTYPSVVHAVLVLGLLAALILSGSYFLMRRSNLT